MAAKTTITVFTPYPFKEGDKIYIADGPRKGDWLVKGLTDKKVHLQCPVSDKKFEWARFCYHTETRQVDQWPQPD
ncbi:MAG: hypothetical protein WBG37_18040 [Desulfobacterales bacterium]